MKNKRVAPSVSYDEGLIQRLKDPQYAVVYLNAILSDRAKGLQERLLTSMHLIGKAHGLSELSRQTKLQRESLRKALSEDGNPRLSSLLALLKAFGIQLRFEPAGPVVKTTKPPAGEESTDQKIDQMRSMLATLLIRQQQEQGVSMGASTQDTTIDSSQVKSAKSASNTVRLGAKNVH